MSISPFSGNVGIGTIGPAAKLTVFGATNSSTSEPFGDWQNNGQLFVETIVGGSTRRLGIGYDTVNDVAVLQAVHPGTAAKTIALNPSNGNVAIGKLSASQKLDVNGNINSDGLIMQSGSAIVPIGTIIPYAGGTVPSGWLLCDGTNNYSRSTYTQLWYVLRGGDTTSPLNTGTNIYTRAGTFTLINLNGDGSLTFGVPDFRGRALIGGGAGQGVGSDIFAARLSQRTVGDLIGYETHTLTEAQMPTHNHGGTTTGSGEHGHGWSGNDEWLYWAGAGNGSRALSNIAGSNNSAWWKFNFGGHSHTISSNGLGQAHNNMQPSVAVLYIIRAK
jgi:microcystin-dependent protein